MSRRSRRNEIYDRENLPEIEEVREVTPETDDAPKMETIKGKVTCSKLNVRNEPSTDSDIMAVIEKNQEVFINPFFENTEWYFVGVKKGPVNIEGYVMSKFIEKE